MVPEEVKRRLYSGSACYHSVHNLLSSHLLSKHVNIKVYKSGVLYGCETWPPTLREEHR